MKIGVTERGDPSLDFSWVSKLPDMDAAVIITKNLTDKVIDAASPYFDRLIFHITCTGYGGTAVEPRTPEPCRQLQQTIKLVKAGFPSPLERIVIRIDPIIPTEKGLRKALDAFVLFASYGFTRFRVSVIDMYPHVRSRFRANKLPLPYGDGGFQPSSAQLAAVDAMLVHTKRMFPDIRIECCAEPGLKEAEHNGCISAADIEQLGLYDKYMLEALDTSGYQRPDCLCCSAKTELLSQKKQCPYGCLYCYWK